MIRPARTFRVRSSIPAPLAALETLAHNLRWSWDEPTRALFRSADPERWATTRGNPVALLSSLSAERLDELAADDAFVARVQEVQADLEAHLGAETWAVRQDVPPPSVAYFSPEFGLTSAMQVYSGGLGVLAGDHLKAASDLGCEITGVGLLYRHGYFRQQLDHDGWQTEHYPDLNPHDLPLRRIHDGTRPATLDVRLADREVTCHIWKAEVGRVVLLLLDSDVPGNAPEDRAVTDKLYGGDQEHRLRQELVLGIGGMRALTFAQHLGEVSVGGRQLHPATVFHCNEGHAGFLQLERIRRLVADEGMSFAEAEASARSGALFTTHTPVSAGIDVFDRGLMERYFTTYAQECGTDLSTLLEVGRDPAGGEGFNMAVMCLRWSAAANGVSRLHGRVARAMFASVWPTAGPDESPITSVTNGVHAATWVGPEMRALFDAHLGHHWASEPSAWSGLSAVSDDELWTARRRARGRMISEIRDHVVAQADRRGAGRDASWWVDQLLDPDALTIGFGRRFTEYKRGNLLLSHPERLSAMLRDEDRPVQLVFAGKAHPADQTGKRLIQQLVRFAESDPMIRRRMVFLADYDMRVAARMYQGVDVWLNTPRRPYEACGTSGQKAAINGALHCSTSDGWWDEMYDGTNGFLIGAAPDETPLHGRITDPDEQDRVDAEEVYRVLGAEIVPEFHDGEGGAPPAWIARMRRSLETLGPQVLAGRMVQQYVGERYRPLAEHARNLTQDGHRRARALAAWVGAIRREWPQVRIDGIDASDGGHGRAQTGDERRVRVDVHLGELSAEDCRVELLHGPVDAYGELTAPESLVLQMAETGHGGSTRYEGTMVCTTAGDHGFTARVTPQHPDLYGDLAMGMAAWAGPDTRPL